LEEDAGAGDVVAVEELGDFDEAAIPDGAFGGFGAGFGCGPGGVVEGGGFAVGDVADVDVPVACGEGVEGLEGVELFKRGGREVLLLADGREGLCGERGDGGGEEQGDGESASSHVRKGSKSARRAGKSRVRCLIGSRFRWL
jgi:hypothetical protein